MVNLKAVEYLNIIILEHGYYVSRFITFEGRKWGKEG